MKKQHDLKWRDIKYEEIKSKIKKIKENKRKPKKIYHTRVKNSKKVKNYICIKMFNAIILFISISTQIK